MEKKRYDRPLIKRHSIGMAAKGGAPTFVKVVGEVDGVKVGDLMAEHGSPLFVMSERRLRMSYSALIRVLSEYFPQVALGWSYKTNWLRAVCSVFHQEGALAEVVSEYEYQKAKDLGMPGGKIIFNGPYKPPDALATAFTDGAMVNIDSLDEMLLCEEVAGRLGLRPRVGLRVSLTAGAYPAWHRFGFNYESGEALFAAERLKQGGVLDFAGLHCHVGTFVLDPNCYFEQAHKLAELSIDLDRKLGLKTSYLNLGGGFASKNTLLHQYLPGETATPSYEEYVSAIAQGFKSARLGRENLPEIILETGRALVDEAGYLLTTVRAVKRLPSGIRAVVVDAGVNVLATAYWYRHEVSPASEYGGDLEPTVVYGPLCMNIDVIRESVNLPWLQAGDPLVIWPAGAYNMTQWLQFIRLRPRVVMVGRGGRVSVIRQEDALEEVISKEPIPEWLIGGGEDGDVKGQK